MYNLDAIMTKHLTNPKLRNMLPRKKTKLNSTTQKCKGHEGQGQNKELAQMGGD